MFVRNPDIVRLELQELKRVSGKGWREIAALPQYSPIPFGTLSAIAKGYPIPKRWHKHFGIVDLVPVPACPICGMAHIHAHDEQVYNPATQVVKPKPKPRNPRPARIAIRKDDMQSAARSIVNHMTASDVDVLIVELRDLLLGENPLDKKNYREEE